LNRRRQGNENETAVEVFGACPDEGRDDFKVEHKKSPVVQMDDYYPFGLTFNSYQRENSVANQYKYNGKEQQDELGLGWSDYGARIYMSDIGRWGAVDPLGESYYDVSSYGYTANDPINYVDPDGERLIPINQRREFRQAIRYLKQSDMGREIIRFLRNHRDNIYVGTPHVSDPERIRWSSGGGLEQTENRRVTWNAYRGRKNTNNSLSSPALALIHELGHMYLELNGDESHTNNQADDQYDDTAEKSTITKIENIVAQELNALGNSEGQRTDHGGTLFWTDKTTSTQPSAMPERAKDIKKRALHGTMHYFAKDIKDKKERREYIKKTKAAIKKHLNDER
jgi:RHS repeat-associated protein